MAFNIVKFLKGIVIREEGTHTPKELEIIPGGSASTKTIITSSQTSNKTLILPDITDTLVTRTNTENLSNKTITASSLDASPVGAVTPSTGDFTSLTADTADINGGTIDDTIIGSITPANGSFSTLSTPDAAISGGSIDNTPIGATVPSTGSFTSLDISGDFVVSADATQTLTNKSLVDNTTSIVDSSDATKKILFDAAGSTSTSTTLRSNQSANRVLDLPDATDVLVGRDTMDTLTNKTLTAPVISGGSIDNTAIGQTTPAAADFTTVDTTSDLNVGGDVIITGDLTVNGTTTTLNTQTLDVEDTNITVNVNGNDASSEGAGLTVNRTGTDGSLIYKDASESKFAIGALGSEDNVVTKTITQTLSNKSLRDTTTAVVDAADSTKKLLFDAAGTTGTSTTLAGSQTVNRVVTLPDATTTLVGTDTTDTLTNKTLQFLRQATATDAVTTGSATTLNAFTTGIVRITNVSLVSLAGIPAGVSGQSLTVENKTGTTISILNEDAGALAANRILTGTAGTVTMQNDATFIFTYDAVSSRWMLTGGSGSGSGSGGINYITNGEANNGTTGWSLYADAPSSRPVNGTGGTPTGLIFTTTGINPISGNASFVFDKDAANRQGSGVSYDFTIERGDFGKVLDIEMDFYPFSGAFTPGTSTLDSSMIVYIYDITNNQLIEPSNIKFFSAVGGTTTESFRAQFQTSVTSLNYRLILHIASTSTAAFQVRFDRVKVAPSEYVYGSPITDWSSFTPTGSWTTNTTYTGRSRRVGDSVQVQVRVSTSGAPVSGNLNVNLPSGMSIDTNKLAHGTGGGFIIKGTASILDTGTRVYAAGVYYNNATSVNIQVLGQVVTNIDYSGSVTPTSPMTFTSGDTVDLEFEVPITGLSSSVQMSDNADTRTVVFVGTKVAAQAVTANVTPLTFSSIKDTHGAFSAGTTYTVPVAGDYIISLSCTSTVADTHIGAFVGGTRLAYVCTIPSANGRGSGSGIAYNLKAGDQLTLVSSTTATINGGTGDNLSISRISGPQTIAATETIAASYYANVNVSTSTVTPINFNTREYDSHGAVTTGAGWRFTAPSAGLYRVGGYIIYPTPTAVSLSVYKNGTVYKTVHSWTTGSTTATPSFEIQLNAGEFIDLRANATITVQGGVLSATGTSHVSITRVGL